MKPLVPLLLIAALAASLPAMADSDHGRGGGWHGGGGGHERGGEPHGNGGGYGRGGRWGGPGGPGGPAGPPAGTPEGGGRWGGGYPGPEAGPDYAAPPRGRPEAYRPEQDEARAGVRSGQFKSMAWVLGRIRRSRAGRVLDADLGQGPNGQPVYRVVWAGADGRRIDYIIDARTGAILQGY
ncbi:MAG TPA: PepSY domain-containing protein [Caulobacteraceae bacterium]